MKNFFFMAGPALFTVALLSAAPLYAARPHGEAKLYCRDKFVRFSPNYNIYLGEAELYFHSVPEAFKGCKITARNVCSSKPVVFKVKRAGLVRIAAAGPPVGRLRNEGWTEVDSIELENPDGNHSGLVVILEKRLEVGSYSIPSQGNFGTRLVMR